MAGCGFPATMDGGMKTDEDHGHAGLEAKIEEAEIRIQNLEIAIDEIGQPAGSELKRRVEALKVEERALRRNLAEVEEGKDEHDRRMAKVEALLAHIQREESSVEHEAAFLHQGNPSSVVLAAEAGAKVIGAIRRGVKKVVGEHPFEQSSVFVNHSHETLVKQYGLKDGGEGKESEGGSSA